jgi:hypothetical protein
MHARATRRWIRRADHAMPLFDRPASGPTPATTIAAAASIEPHAPRLQDRVLQLLQAHGDRGATGEEIAAELQLRTSSATARVNELVQLGKVRDSGSTRENSSGRRAIVWVVKPKD